MRPKPSISLWQITAPHMTAGFTVDNMGVVGCTAPILKWASNKTFQEVAAWCRKKKYKLEFVKEDANDHDER